MNSILSLLSVNSTLLLRAPGFCVTKDKSIPVHVEDFKVCAARDRRFKDLKI